MKRTMSGSQAWIMLVSLVLLLGGCLPPLAMPPPEEGQAAKADDLNHRERFRSRPPIRTTRNLYEGGLWRGAASWGNLMRDHRARYRGDLLTVREMPKIINIPELKIDPVVKPTPQAEQAGTSEILPEIIDPVIAYLREQEKRRERIELEQNDILRSISSIEVEVVRVLPNGNMLVRGVHPPIFRDRNRVKYVVSLQGIVRPSDVDDRNSISAVKLSKAEYKMRRLVRRTSLMAGRASSALRAVGARREGEFVDRLSSFLTTSRPRVQQRPLP